MTLYELGNVISELINQGEGDAQAVITTPISPGYYFEVDGAYADTLSVDSDDNISSDVPDEDLIGTAKVVVISAC